MYWYLGFVSKSVCVHHVPDRAGAHVRGEASVVKMRWHALARVMWLESMVIMSGHVFLQRIK